MLFKFVTIIQKERRKEGRKEGRKGGREGRNNTWTCICIYMCGRTEVRNNLKGNKIKY